MMSTGVEAWFVAVQRMREREQKLKQVCKVVGARDAYHSVFNGHDGYTFSFDERKRTFVWIHIDTMSTHCAPDTPAMRAKEYEVRNAVLLLW